MPLVTRRRFSSLSQDTRNTFARRYKNLIMRPNVIKAKTKQNANTRTPGMKLVQFKMNNKYYRLYPNGYLRVYNMSKGRPGNVVAKFMNGYRPAPLRN